MKITKKLILIAIISFFCVGCDQYTKSIASSTLKGNQATSYLYDTVRVKYAENTGAFLGLGKNLPAKTRNVLFTGFVAVILTGLLMFLLFNSSLSPISITAFSLIFSGGIGNLIDRVVNNGFVVDFLNLGIGSIRTGIFNIADVALMIGFGILIFSEINKPKNENNF